MRRLVTRRPFVISGILLAVVLTQTDPAAAQGLLGRIKQKAKEKAAQATERAATSIVDGAESVVKCAAGDKRCADEAGAAGKTVVTSKGDTIRPPAPSAAVPSGAGARPPSATSAPASISGAAAPVESAAANGDPGKGVWLNWDFKPGDLPIFIEDFAKDEVGDFPRRLALIEGNYEVADVGGRRMLRTNTVGAVSITLPTILPDRFTLEFDIFSSYGTIYVSFDPVAPTRYRTFNPADAETYIETTIGSSISGLHGAGVASQATVPTSIKDRLVTQRLMVDGAYAKLYLDDTRVANVPITKIARGKRISFHVYGYTETPVFIGNIRVMAGGKKLYDALLKSGRVATQGIYFDTGSDRLRGESSATLKEIAQMLTDHADLRLTIEGHTDNVGAAASNQSLSERRAAAVRAALVRNYGVAEERLTSVGFGAAKPVAPNTAEEGRQQNRRVELVRVGS